MDIRQLSVNACALAALLSPAAAFAQGPTLYLSSGNAQTLQAIDVSTGNRLYIETINDPEYPIAVRDTIWIAHSQYETRTASEYDPATGLPTGNTSNLAGPGPQQLLDGAASPTQNYTIDFQTREVFVGQPDWTGLTTLFTIPGEEVSDDVVDGITYDTASDTLWFTTSTEVFEYDLLGNQLSSFPHVAGRGGLAYEASSDTLWIVPNASFGDLRQYSKAGTLLDSVTTPSRGFNVWGAEFQTVPEPGSFALLGIAGAFAAARRRR